MSGRSLTFYSIQPGGSAAHSIRSHPLPSDLPPATTLDSDTHIYVWSVAKPTKNIAIKNAHAGGVNAVCWLGGAEGSKIASAGPDACVRVYDVTRHV